MATIAEQWIGGTLRVAVLSRAGEGRVDLRFFMGRVPEHGVSLNVRHLPRLIEALQRTETAARAAGLFGVVEP